MISLTNKVPKEASGIVACLDIGSSKVVCVIADVSSSKIRILGYGHKASKGIISSTISDMKLAQRAIISAVSEAERMAGFNVSEVIVGISAAQVRSDTKSVKKNLQSRTILPLDMVSIASKIRSIVRSEGREVIHLIPLQYKIDDGYEVENPCYMTGQNLFAKFHAVSISETAIRNVEKCLKACHLSAANYSVNPFASSLVCLNENEMKMGTLLIEIGSNSTSFCVIRDEKLVHVNSVKLGGTHITRDISTIFGISLDHAEQIKSLNSFLETGARSRNDPIDTNHTLRADLGIDFNSPIITKGNLSDVVKSRVEEIIESVKIKLDSLSFPMHMITNVVLCGGVSYTIGIENVASRIFYKSAKVAHINYSEHFDGCESVMNNLRDYSSLGMLKFLREIYVKNLSGATVDVKKGWFKKLAERLMLH